MTSSPRSRSGGRWHPRRLASSRVMGHGCPPSSADQGHPERCLTRHQFLAKSGNLESRRRIRAVVGVDHRSCVRAQGDLSAGRRAGPYTRARFRFFDFDIRREFVPIKNDVPRQGTRAHHRPRRPGTDIAVTPTTGRRLRGLKGDQGSPFPARHSPECSDPVR
jgi:hypothetical protein